VEQNFAEQVTDIPDVPNIVLDASVLDGKESDELVREEIKLTNIIFEFPYVLTDVDLRETCRALCDLENFDVLYDYTMQALSGKTLKVWMRGMDGAKYLLDEVHIVDKYQDLRIVDCFAEWPWLVNWLVEFMGAYLGKQFPMPGQKPVRKASEEKKGGKPGPEKPSKTG
jgi:hypothetical protein